MENPPSQAPPQFKVVPATYRPTRAHLRGDVQVDWSYLLYCLFGTVFFFTFSPLILNLAAFVPDFDTGSQLYEHWYYRYTVNTTWFPLSQFVAFMGLAIYGWTFINLINCQRNNPFTDGNNSYKSFKQLLVVAPILFLMSGIIVFRQENDLSGYCNKNGVDHPRTIFLREAHANQPANEVVLSAVLEAQDDTLLLLHTLQTSDYMKDFHAQTPATCHDYTPEEVFNWNFYLWVTSFILLGLQFTHADIGPMQHFELTWASMKTWGAGLWTIFLSMAVVVVALLYVDYTDIHACDALIRYLVYGAALVGFFVWNTKRLAPVGRHLHIHHYVVGFVINSFIGYQCVLLTIAHGFTMGMMIEGGCRWGFDPIWTDHEPDVDDSDVLKANQEHRHTVAERKRWNEIKAHQSQIRSANEKKFAAAHAEATRVSAPERVSYTMPAQYLPQTTYLQPTMLNMPVPQPLAYQRAPAYGFTYLAQPMPMPVIQQQQQPRLIQVQPEQPQMMYNYVYHPEPVYAPQPAAQQPTKSTRSTLPSELLGLLTPEL